jgi:hypothetical protein
VRFSMNRNSLFGLLVVPFTWIPLRNRTSAVRPEVLDQRTVPNELTHTSSLGNPQSKGRAGFENERSFGNLFTRFT